jgi:hypothetical protein
MPYSNPVKINKSKERNVAYLQKNLYVFTSGLTATGEGPAYAIDQPNRHAPTNIGMYVTVASINTNVVVRLDGSIDGTNYAPLITGQTITGNGTQYYGLANTPVKYVKPIFVSESGGTAAVVSFGIAAN